MAIGIDADSGRGGRGVGTSRRLTPEGGLRLGLRRPHRLLVAGGEAAARRPRHPRDPTAGRVGGPRSGADRGRRLLALVACS